MVTAIFQMLKNNRSSAFSGICRHIQMGYVMPERASNRAKFSNPVTVPIVRSHQNSREEKRGTCK